MALNRSQLDLVGKLLRHGSLERAGKILDRLHPGDVSELIESCGPAESRGLVDVLFAPRRASQTLRNLPEQQLRQILERIEDKKLGQLVEGLSTDDAVMFLDLLGPDRVAPVCERLDAEHREHVLRVLRFPPGTAGRLITTDFLAVQQSITAQRAIEEVRHHAEQTDSVSYLYAVDEDGRLKGVVPFWRLVSARPDRPLSSFMDTEPVVVNCTADQESAAELASRHGLLSLPVLEEDGKLAGVITVDDIVDVVKEEATEDIQKMGGMEALDAPYLKVGIPSMIRKRAIWLCVLFVGELLTATAMGHFEDEIKRAVVLSLFIPLIISSGGNSGSQATTLVIRAMALGEVRLEDWWRVVRRELLTGLALGCILGSLGLLRILLYAPPGNEAHAVLLSITIFFSLIGVVLFGTLTGSMLPFLLRRLGLDPASASAPFVATLVDVTGLVIYFTVASVLLRGTLL